MRERERREKGKIEREIEREGEIERQKERKIVKEKETSMQCKVLFNL